MIIKRVQRLATFKHDVIRHVHDIANAADADFFQRAFKPVRTRPDFHTFDDARGVTRTNLRVFDFHRNQVSCLAAAGRKFDLCNPQRITSDRRNFTCNTDDAVEVGTVRRDFEVINNIAATATEKFAKRFSNGCVGWQN